MSAQTTTPTRSRRQVGQHSARYLLSHAGLLTRVTRNELTARYAGSMLGVGWTVITPALFLSMYSVVYLFVYRASVPGLTKWQYVVYVMAGIIPYLVTAEAIGNGVTSVVANRSVVTNVVFPIDLLPAKAVAIAQPTMLFGMAVTAIAALVSGLGTWYLLLLPVIWILHVMALLGVVWILSLINIVLRDLTHLIGILLLLLLIASPIGYTPDQVPSSLRFILALNPLAYFIVAYQRIVVLGMSPSPLTAFGVVAFALTAFFFGGWFFSRMKATLVDYV